MTFRINLEQSENNDFQNTTIYTLSNNITPYSDQKLNYLVGTPVYAQNLANIVLDAHLRIKSE